MEDSTNGLLLDTTVLVDLLRGREAARDYLQSIDGEMAISVLTVAEIHAGSRESDAMPIARLISLFRVVPVTVAVGQLGGLHRQQFGGKHGTSLVDALIAATAIVHNYQLVTHNTRHFPMLPNSRLVVPY